MKGLIAIVVLGLVIVIVAGDITGAPTPAKGQCILVRRTILPDYCANSCNPPFDCTKTTRPYAFFSTQAASCDDAVICQ